MLHWYAISVQGSLFDLLNECERCGTSELAVQVGLCRLFGNLSDLDSQ